MRAVDEKGLLLRRIYARPCGAVLCAPGIARLALRPKSFNVLRYLVENAGRLVSKDELAEAVWPNAVVGDESVTRCVSDVRLALGDNDQRIIKTVLKQGYLFVAPISQPDARFTRPDDAVHHGTAGRGAISCHHAFRHSGRRPRARRPCRRHHRRPDDVSVAHFRYRHSRLEQHARLQTGLGGYQTNRSGTRRSLCAPGKPARWRPSAADNRPNRRCAIRREPLGRSVRCRSRRSVRHARRHHHAPRSHQFTLS